MSHRKATATRQGTSQQRRQPGPLAEDFVRLDERSPEALRHFARKVAALVRYYDAQNQPAGTWEPFFSDLADPSAPHYALFDTFLHLYGNSQNHLNGLLFKHLDFYYERALRLLRKKALPDQVHVLFSLAKHVPQHLLEKGTLLSAGTDAQGQPRVYALDRDLVVNRAQIGDLKSVYLDHRLVGEREEKYRLYTSSQPTDSQPFRPWAPFGEPNGEQARPARLGFALSSPLLSMSSGRRIIFLRCRFSKPLSHHPQQKTTASQPPLTKINLDGVLSAQLSGPKGWVPVAAGPEWDGTILPPSDQAELRARIVGEAENRVLELRLEIPPTAPAIASHGHLPGPWPVLQVFQNHQVSSILRNKLYALPLEGISLKVMVEGKEDLHFSNDIGVLDASKSFLPFGNQPKEEASVYLGAPEVLSKPLQHLSLTLNWDQPPQNFGTHYQGYGPPGTTISNQSFRTAVALRAAKRWSTVAPEHPLFDPHNAQQAHTISLLETGELPWAEEAPTPKPSTYHPEAHQGFLRLTLHTPIEGKPFRAFGHQEYPQVYLKAILANQTNPQLPQAPYSPRLKRVRMNYTAEVDLLAPTDGWWQGQFYHLEPFGYTPPTTNTLLPQYEHEGTFYLGLRHLSPPQNVSVLLQIAEGSADPNHYLRKDQIHWSILTAGGWQKLADAQKLSDSTDGFLGTGIMEFQIPESATADHPLMPTGQYWLRAQVKTQARGAGKLLALHTQAAQATFVDQNNDPSHLTVPLAAGEIKQLQHRNAAVAEVQQPYASFGGKPAESRQAFYTRVSERLRHKLRGISVWDYERLVLEKFPRLFQVRCLNHTSPQARQAPGAVTLVVIPDLRNQNAVSTLMPRAGVHLLAQVKQYLGQHLSPFVTLHVQNPEYEQVLLDFKVRFRAGYDEGYHMKLLNEALRRFLSPWAYESGREAVFGGRVYKSVVLAFVEEQPYVDFVLDFKLFHIVPAGIGKLTVGQDFGVAFPDDLIKVDVPMAAATSPRAILVSFPQHNIGLLREGETTCQGAQGLGVGYWAIDVDLTVT